MKSLKMLLATLLLGVCGLASATATTVLDKSGKLSGLFDIDTYNFTISTSRYLYVTFADSTKGKGFLAFAGYSIDAKHRRQMGSGGVGQRRYVLRSAGFGRQIHRHHRRRVDTGIESEFHDRRDQGAIAGTGAANLGNHVVGYRFCGLPSASAQGAWITCHSQLRISKASLVGRNGEPQAGSPFFIRNVNAIVAFCF